MPEAKPKKSGIGGTVNGGSNGGNGSRNGEGGAPSPHSMEMARMGMWVALISLIMWFGALGMLYFSRMDEKLDYRFVPPKILWLSTALLLASSIPCQLGLLRIRQGDREGLLRFLTLTLFIGVLFIISQSIAWYQIWSEYVATGQIGRKNPFTGLFYILTGVHAIHILGGIGWLWVVRNMAAKGFFSEKRHLAVYLSVMYWHFMDAVWVPFFVLIMI